MKSQMRSSLLAGVVMLCGWVNADIPGVFVVQEAQVQNPFPPGALPNEFGGSSMAWIGDFDGNGVDDFITGVPKAYSDSGCLLIQLLNSDGTQKGVSITISPRDPMIAPSLSNVKRDQFGGTVQVVQAFSRTENDAVVVASSKAVGKLWALRLRRSGNAISVIDTATIDTSRSSVLSGLRASVFGESMEILDTIASSKKRVIAIGVPAAKKATGSSLFGRVLILEFDPITLSWVKRGQIPETWDATDVIGGSLPADADFGRSLARLGKLEGDPVLGVLASGDGSIGKLYAVRVDSATGAVKSASSSFFSADGDTLLYPFSISSSDFDHDGIHDLVVGLPSQDGPNRISGMGGFAVVKLDEFLMPSAIQRFGKGVNGFVGGAGLGEGTGLGYVSLAGDFDHDRQTDALIGIYGYGSIQGSILPLRMKAKPWLLRTPDTIALVSDPVKANLAEFISGNALKWSISEVDPPVTGSLTSCGIIQSSEGTFLRCVPFATNGYSKWKVIASDTGNVPANEHFSEGIIFVVRVKDQNVPPRRTDALPGKILLQEDQADSVVLVFSKHFEDPDGRPLRFELVPLNGSVASLLNYYLSPNYDTLHLQPIPLRFGLCSLQVVVKDDAGASLLDTIVVQVQHVNHAPVAKDDAYEVVESTPSRFGVKANDNDVDLGDGLTIAIAIPPRHGKAAMDGDTLVYVPDSFHLGEDSIRYRLSDGLDSAFAWIRITISKTTQPLRIHKAMRDTVVEEDSNPIVIQVDSLFFSGSLRFNVSIHDPVHTCQGLASVALDPSRKRFTVSPLENAFGSCRIWIQESQEGKLSDTMRLELKPVLTPYQFPRDTLTLRMTSGKEIRMALDTVDLDKDTLIYSVPSMPGWARLESYGLVLDPDVEEGKILLEARKKPLPGIAFLEPSDTLVVYAMFETSTVRRRSIGERGTSYSFDGSSAMLVHGGRSSFQIQILSLNGRSVANVSGSAGDAIRLSLPSGSRLLILRLIEEGRTLQTPLMRQR